MGGEVFRLVPARLTRHALLEIQQHGFASHAAQVEDITVGAHQSNRRGELTRARIAYLKPVLARELPECPPTPRFLLCVDPKDRGHQCDQNSQASRQHKHAP